MICEVKVNNVPENARKYVVARFDHEHTHELWFWGSWDEREKAEQAAGEVSGVVFERMEA